jgi:hypothetical protein
MSQTTHPLDDELVDFEVLHRKLVRHLGADGEWCARDREILTFARRIHTGVGQYREREVAADAYKRNGPTRRTRDHFRRAGDALVSLEEVRARKKIVAFPSARNEAG